MPVRPRDSPGQRYYIISDVRLNYRNGDVRDVFQPVGTDISTQRDSGARALGEVVKKVR